MKTLHADVSNKIDEFINALDKYVTSKIVDHNSPHISDTLVVNQAEYDLRKKLGELLDYDMGE